MKDRFKIGVIGGGSWGTALVKILLNNVELINWYVRGKDKIQYIKQNHHNPKYLSHTEIDAEKIHFFDHIKEAIDHSDVIIFAIPAGFLKPLLDQEDITFDNKFVISAIKGIIPGVNLTVTKFFHYYYQIPFTSLAVISGPCHAEEVAMERLSYLSIASKRLGKVEKIARKLKCDYISVIISRDVFGIEYAGVLKNIISIASGIAHGLGYGDNFQAVLVSNAMREIGRFLRRTSRSKRRMYRSVYLGDLMVTCYSKFSRNRTLGIMIGKGYTVKSALLELNMVAEGYYALESMNNVLSKRRIKMPIIEAVYNIVKLDRPPADEMKSLAEKLR
ncbi:MAG: NAD(P)H-dependent glycerol-3-phosphate dehydrogenase [bacterium]